MIDYQLILGGASAALALIAYTLYFRSIFRGETKPHVYTWLVYAVIDGIVFAIQFAEGAGAGSWILGVAAVMNAIITLLALRSGLSQIRAIDTYCLIGAIVGIGVWLLLEDPLAAVVVFVLINMFAAVPTFRKSYVRPNEESVSIWAFDVVKFSLSILALESLTLTTALFPAAIVLTNAVLTAMILLRRRQLARIP